MKHGKPSSIDYWTTWGLCLVPLVAVLWAWGNVYTVRWRSISELEAVEKARTAMISYLRQCVAEGWRYPPLERWDLRSTNAPTSRWSVDFSLTRSNSETVILDSFYVSRQGNRWIATPVW